MNLISRRRTAGLLGAGALVVITSLATAAPAGAFPSDSWWYGELSVAKAQQVSKGSGVTVAVLDTGVQASLGDLSGRVLPGRSFVGTGDPRVDLPDPAATYFGHGTAMAAYIAGTGKGAGLVGIAPAAKILPVRVARTGDTSDIDAVAQGIRWAADQGAKVINMSVGTVEACSPAVQSAVDHALEKDVVLVAATGNTPGNPVASPANCIGVLAVGGLADAKALTGWSGGTTGPALDFVAPAQNLRQLLLTDKLSQNNGDGTSSAAALVSGTFALLRSRFPTESARQIVTRALWNVANGLPGDVFAKRVDDKLGYGEILPSFALTEAPPRNAANPIYDEVDKHLAASSAAPSAGGSSAPPSSTPSAGATDSSSDGLSSGLVAALGGGGVVIVVAVVVLVARSRRRRPVGAPYGGPPYGPPDSH